MIPEYLLDAVKQILGWKDTANDAWLEAMLATLVTAATSATGAVFLPTVVYDVFRPARAGQGHGCGCGGSGCPALYLSQYPVLSLDKVQLDGVPQDPESYTVSPLGHLYQADQPVRLSGLRMEFSYTAGYDPLPPDVILALAQAAANQAAQAGIASGSGMPISARKISIVDVGSIDLGQSGFDTSGGHPLFGNYGQVLETYARAQVSGHPCVESALLGAPAAP